MKDVLLDGHRGKVALSDTTRNQSGNINSASNSATATNNTILSNSSGAGKCDLKAPTEVGGGSSNNDGTAATNFDDDYNEWELGIGDLIIDLDADIEKTNERNNHAGHHHQNGTLAGTSAVGPPSASLISSSTSPTTNAAGFAFLGGSQQPSSCGSNAGVTAMSGTKASRGSSGTGNATSSASAPSSSGVLVSGSNSNSNSSANGQAVEHQATVDKGLKMKIKRKTVGNKYSEAKHEIVQSDTKASSSSSSTVSENGTLGSGSNGAGINCSATVSDTPKSKHSSGKGRNSSHREKKEKNRDKDKGSSARNTATTSCSSSASSTGNGGNSSSNNNATNPIVEMNGVLSVMSPSLKITNAGVSLSSPSGPVSPNSATTVLPQQNSGASSSAPNVGQQVPRGGSTVATGCSGTSATSGTDVTPPEPQSNQPPPNFASSGPTTLPTPLTISSSSSPPMPNLTLKLETKFSPTTTTTPCSVMVNQDDVPCSPPLKRIKLESDDNEMEGDESPIPPEMKDTSTCTSVGTITEPDCLGPCEPGTSVMLEGIVWQETEGGVLVVNVTWRGKTYVGTLLDCTKHDWAPPRFCESPTSDVDNKTSKGRGKRGRSANNNCNEMNTFDVRNCVQSKLRNGKGRRTTINSSNFTVPSSPAKSDSGSSAGTKRKGGRPADLELTPTTPVVAASPAESAKSSKRSRVQSRGGTPTAPGGNGSGSEFPQPSSPVLIECPEPNCNKKYKHINGLRYHQQHAHSGSSDGAKVEDPATEDSKDVTNSSDNEEGPLDNTSVPPSPAMSFANTVSPHQGSSLPVENNSSSNSSSSNVPSLPESDPYSLTPDLSTLASVAIGDPTNTSQELPVIVSVDGTRPPSSTLPPTMAVSTVDPSVIPTPSVISVVAPAADGPIVPAASSVIHCSSSVSDAPPVVNPAVTVSIPTSHVVFNQGNNAVGCITTAHTPVVSCHSSVSPRPGLSTVSAATYVPVAAAVIPPVSSPSSIDKSKCKQQQQQLPLDRLDKYKPKSPASTPAIRPIVPAPPTQLIALSTNISSHPVLGSSGHGLLTSSLKPIQPKPTILGEPTTINPALESLKREKSKHKKKSKDRDRERKPGVIGLNPVKLPSSHPGEECEPMDISSYPSLEAVSRDSLNPSSITPSVDGQKAAETPMDISVADDNMNENVQSPAYSDISDANDTAPVLESEVSSGKEKEDKMGKGPPDAAQSPAANITAYGMYPYYSQPPYLLPSVSPQSSVSATQPPSTIDKPEQAKKIEHERIKESRPWSNPGGGVDRPPVNEVDPVEKKPPRENTTPNPSVISSPASVNVPLQDYQVQQPYPYPYGYVHGYPYSVEPAYHMHLLDSDPNYKQQYKQYIEDQQRLYKEQQHHHHHQQQQQQQQQQQHAHNQQLQQHHSHSHHSQHSQHQLHHQQKIHHSSMFKDDRDRSREHKERSDKMAASVLHGDHASKIQHSSSSMAATGSKEHDILRDHVDGRPPSLPMRGDSSTPSSALLKEKQNENHQILKENIELKSQMDDNKANKINQYEMAMLYERHREDMRRYYMLQERLIEQQQKMEPGFHHHTHHHQTMHQLPSHSSLPSKHKDELSGHVKHYAESARSSSVVSPAKTDHLKSSSSHPHSSSSPKGGPRESSSVMAKEYSRDNSSSKKESKDRLDGSSGRDDKSKIDKIKTEPKPEPEGQKPTMETTGPPPPPTNAYAYLHPSYLQPPPPHFPHMPFEPAHAVYRGGLNPMIMSAPTYGGSPYMHPQLRYVPPGACEIPTHPQQADPLPKGLHQPGPPKALDLLHQVSQHYTTHKIHELQEHALMSPTPTSTPVSSSTTSSTSSSAAAAASVAGGKNSSSSSSDLKTVDSGNRDSSRSPPTQRHLHTHHHTHVGVGYPLYDHYGVAVQKPCT